MSRLLLFALFSTQLFGQFSNLAANADGSLIYFVTSLRQKTEAALNLPTTPAIYSLDSAGNIQRVTTPPAFNAAFPLLTQNPQVSGDGSVFSYTVETSCVGGSSCELSYPSTYFSYLSVGGKPYPQSLGGSAQVSRNGRYVLSYGAWSIFTQPQTLYNNFIDLRTNTTVQPPIRPISSRQSVTSDGRLVGIGIPAPGANPVSLQIWNSTQTRVVPTVGPPSGAIINDSGSEVVYEYLVTPSSTSYTVQLRAVDLISGADNLIATRPNSFSTAPSISDDGALVAYVAEPQPGQKPQAWLARTDGTSSEQLTNLPGGVSEVLLLGSGTKAIAVSGSQIVSIDTYTKNVQVLLGPTPTCYLGSYNLIPGSVLSIIGADITPITQTAPTPLPSSLAGVQVLMNGTPLPILSISPAKVLFQVPFDLAPGPFVSVQVPTSSIFEGCPAQPSPVAERKPSFVSGGGFLTLAHQDFQGLVTPASPVRPGEIVHAYAVGLGVVTPVMQTGVPTPTDRLFTVSQPFTCVVGYPAGNQPLNVLFAGLAPGAIGLYQVDVQMPSPLPTQNFLLDCGTPGNTSERDGGQVPVPVSSQ